MFGLGFFLFALTAFGSQDQRNNCRFANNFTKEQLLTSEASRNRFLESIFTWEANFHTHKVGYNKNTGFTYDGHVIDYDSGELSNVPNALHDFSAPSKESLHLIMLARSLEGNRLAQTFISPNSWSVSVSLDILKKKIATYRAFNTKYPGYGGYLPWVRVNDLDIDLLPEWSDRVPSLDNGEWIWGIYAVAKVCKYLNFRDVASDYLNYFNMLAANANMIFNNGDGYIRAESKIYDIHAAPSPQNYANNVPNYFLDDPYEGELFVVFTDLFGNWSGYESTKDLIWKNKASKLVSVEYSTSSGPITVEQGFWYSSHEKWKVLELPYLSVPIYQRLFVNGEKARTLNSQRLSIPGLYASAANISIDHKNTNGYVSAVGIQSIASQKVENHFLITPYGAYPVALVNLPVGLVWYHAMLSGSRMQGPYGSTESCDYNGTAIGNVVTWDSKVTSLCGFVGGVMSVVEDGLAQDGKLSLFQQRIGSLYTNAFPVIKGENQGFGLPKTSVPQILSDFTACH